MAFVLTATRPLLITSASITVLLCVFLIWIISPWLPPFTALPWAVSFILGEFKNRLHPWMIAKEPYLDLYSNLDRNRTNRQRNPTVTNSAKHGAYLAIELLNSIDTKLLLSELIINSLFDWLNSFSVYRRHFND